MFDGIAEICGIPEHRNDTVIDELLRNWKECPVPGKNKKKTDPLEGMEGEVRFLRLAILEAPPHDS